MSKKGRKETLADKIADVLHATPTTFDPEDDDLDNTRAQVADIEPYDEDDAEELLLSKFRAKNVNLLADSDERYSGVKASRRDLYESDEQSENDEVDGEEQSSESDERDESAEESTDQNGDGGEFSDSEGDEDTYDKVEEDTSGQEDFGDDAELEHSDIKTIAETDVSAQVKKGLCVRNQMQIWESLLEMRIQLQKSLITANKMPQKETFTEIKKNSGKEFTDQLAVTKNSLAKVLHKLLTLQTLVLKKYPETKNLDSAQRKDTAEDEDEEIPSDTDDEKDEIVEEEEEIEEQPKKKRKLSEFGEEIRMRHDKYKTYRNSVIQKWNDKTRIATIKNNSNASSVLNHIEHILNDKERLIKRTQLKRSEYTILGQEPPQNDDQQTEECQETRRLEEYNSDIFDDDDFYHQLLRELIEVKSADLTDPVQLSRQWIQLQNLRSKMKRKVDTRATKGRKIRYAVHNKLVNFMAPIDKNLWTEEAKNELFNSLFGKLERVAV